MERKQKREHRLLGLDVARAIAILGMLIVNFRLVMCGEGQPASFWGNIGDFWEGRASATFITIAGIGIMLFLRRKSDTDVDFRELAARKAILYKRAGFLFVFGTVFSILYQADILHYYGVYIVVALLLFDRSYQIQKIAAFLFVTGFVVLAILFNYDSGWDWNNLYYIDFWTMTGFFRHLFFNGFHPVFPWVVFIIVGLWLGKRDLKNPKVQIKLLFLGLITVITAESASWLITRRLIHLFPLSEHENIQILFGTKPIPPLPFYVISAQGSALVFISLSLFISRVAENWPLIRVLGIIGQMSLSHYIFHVLWGMGLLATLGMVGNQPASNAMLFTMAYYLIASGILLIWYKYYHRGPFEMLMRKITG